MTTQTTTADRPIDRPIGCCAIIPSFCSAPSHWTDLDERRRERGNKRVLQLRQQDQEFLNRLPFLDLE